MNDTRALCCFFLRGRCIVCRGMSHFSLDIAIIHMRPARWWIPLFNGASLSALDRNALVLLYIPIDPSTFSLIAPPPLPPPTIAAGANLR